MNIIVKKKSLRHKLTWLFCWGAGCALAAIFWGKMAALYGKWCLLLGYPLTLGLAAVMLVKLKLWFD